MLDRNPASIRAEREREAVVDLVLTGICAALDRAFEDGGEATCSLAARAERAGRKHQDGLPRVQRNAALTGWIPHGESMYHHLSDPSILVKRIGRGRVRREGRSPMRANLWGWRRAGETGPWIGAATSRMGAFEAARLELGASDV